MTKTIKYNFAIIICTVLGLSTGCRKQTEKPAINGKNTFEEIISDNSKDQGGSPNWSKVCELSCPEKGYRIKILQKVVGSTAYNNFRLLYEPNIYIYMGQAEHDATIAGTANPKYNHGGTRPILYGATDPNHTFNDQNGNPILGDVWQHTLKVVYQTCNVTWQTAEFSPALEPCVWSATTVVNHMNSSPNKPGCCGLITICSGSSGPVTGNSPPIFGTQSSYYDKAFWGYETIWSFDCHSGPGICKFKVDDPGADFYDEYGPVHIQLTDDGFAHIVFWRDIELASMSINESNDGVNDGFKEMYQLPADTKFKHGIYDILFENFEFGEVLIELE